MLTRNTYAYVLIQFVARNVLWESDVSSICGLIYTGTFLTSQVHGSALHSGQCATAARRMRILQ
jgi:hypothetical protein